MTSRWRLVARRAIQGAIASLPPDCDRSELKKVIDQSYPFTVRDYHPYKIWLSERKKFFIQLGIYPVPDGNNVKPGIKHDPVSPGQMSLFDFE